MENRVENFKEFCRFLSEVRGYFVSQGFLETPTPTLVPCPGMEAHLDPIEAKVDGKSERFLPTSPEIHLKKRLCQGFEKIFELRPCFRNDPATPLHRSEFFMLEWYRANAPLESLKTDIHSLLKHLKTKDLWPHEIEGKGVRFDELFADHFRFNFRADTSVEELQKLFRDRGIYYASDDSKIDLIHRVLMEKFEPSFRGLTFLEAFPPEMAILSRLGEDGFACRFELYFAGVELANAFYEVNDPRLQKERWELDSADRKRLGVRDLPLDQELLNLMTVPGMPEASGIALGLDRLFMVAKGLKHIDEIGF